MFVRTIYVYILVYTTVVRLISFYGLRVHRANLVSAVTRRYGIGSSVMRVVRISVDSRKRFLPVKHVDARRIRRGDGNPFNVFVAARKKQTTTTIAPIHDTYYTYYCRFAIITAKRTANEKKKKIRKLKLVFNSLPNL